MKDSLNVVIAGSTGYIGLELVKILSSHPNAKILYLCATSSIGKSINYFDKRIKKKTYQKFQKLPMSIGKMWMSYLQPCQMVKLKKLLMFYQNM